MNVEEKIKKEFEEKLFDKINESYWEICNSKNRDSLKNEICKEYNRQCNDILKRNSKIMQVLEDQNTLALDETDVKDLIEYLMYAHYRKIEEDKYLMIRVAKDTYLLLKKFGMIKEIDE